MKNIIILAISVVLSTVALCQTQFIAYKLDVGKKVNNEWVFDGVKDVFYTITISKNKLNVNDKGNTTMIVTDNRIEKDGDSQMSHIWDGDSMGNFVSLTEHKDNKLVTMAFVYGDKCYVYYIKPKKVHK